MDGAGKAEVSLATGVVGPEVIAEDLFVQGEPACSCAVAGLRLSACNGMSLRGALCVQWQERQAGEGEGSEPWPSPVSPGAAAGHCRCRGGLQQCWRFDYGGCISLGHEMVEWGPQGHVGCCLGRRKRTALLLLCCSLHALV